MNCWVLSDGKAGMETQCLGLAQAMGLSAQVKRIQVMRPWRWLPPTWVPNALEKLGPKGDSLSPPWPDMIIASGRQSIASSLAVKKASKGQCFTIQIQNPVVDPALFDVIVTPKHDQLEGPNIISTFGSLGQVTLDRLKAEAEKFTPQFAALPQPRVAVLLGGNNKVFRMTSAVTEKLAAQLSALTDLGAGLMITPSRRTGTENISLLQKALSGASAQIWDGLGDNPYFGMLGLADYVIVTCDSINMACEAAGTGKPVFVVALEGGSAKFTRFHDSLRTAGISRPFAGVLEDWTYEPLAETRRAADEIWHRYRSRH